MQTLRIASNIIEMMNRQMLASSNNHYKQVLRSLLNTFGGLYYVDGNGKKVKIKCSTGRMERAKGKDFQDNTLILPYISIFERGTINDDQRRRYTPVLVNEVVWDPEEMRAKRYLSLAPRPVTISYDINVWTKYVEDMDIIRSTILSLFNPDLEIETEENEYIKAFFDSEGDLESEEQDDTADRIIKKRFSITVETYIKSPKILYTNTSQINTQNNEIVITGEGRKNGKGPRKFIERGTNLGVIDLTLSDFLTVYSDSYNLGVIDLSLSSNLVTQYISPNDVDIDIGYLNLDLSSLLVAEFITGAPVDVDLGSVGVTLSNTIDTALTYFEFPVIGIDDVTENSLFRFTSVVADECGNAYVGCESTDGSGSLWKYNASGWSQLDLPSEASSLSVKSLLMSSGNLIVGTAGSTREQNAGKVFMHDGTGWTNLNLQSTLLPGFHSSVRALHEFNNNLFAGGSYAVIGRYNGTSWADSYLDAEQFHWNDFASDGSSMYAAGNAFQASGNVFKFNGTSWSKISLNGFGNQFNYNVTKLCVYNNELYAGTLNSKDGAEVWKYSGSGTSWTKFNESGFGTTRNYSIASMTVIDNKLVVTTEGILGGEVWYYHPDISLWVNETVTAAPKYTSYLPVEIAGSAVLIGTNLKRLIPDAEESSVLISASERRDNRLTYWPDGPLAGISLGSGQYRFIGPNALMTTVTEGTLEDIAQTIVSPSTLSIYLSAIDTLSPLSGYSDGGILRGDQILGVKTEASSFNLSSTAFNQVSTIYDVQPYDGMKYYSIHSIHKVSGTDVVFGFGHTEIGYWPLSSSPFLAWKSSIRLAVSLDNGITFSDVGDVIRSPRYAETAYNSSVSGKESMGMVSVIASGDYLNIYYSNDDNPASATVPRSTFSLARIALSDLYACSSTLEPPPCYKYFNSAFTQPGLGGSSTDLLSYPPDFDSQGAYYTFYSNKLGKFVSLISNQKIIVDNNLYFDKIPVNVDKSQDTYAIYSDDGINWSYPELLYYGESNSWYVSILHENIETNYCDDDFRIIQLRGGIRQADLKLFDVTPQELRAIDRSYTSDSFARCNPYSLVDLSALSISFTDSLSAFLSYDIELSGDHPSEPLPDISDRFLSLGTLDLQLSALDLSTEYFPPGSIYSDIGIIDLTLDSDIGYEFVFEIPLIGDHPSEPLPDEYDGLSLGILNLTLDTSIDYYYGFEEALLGGDYESPPEEDE